jgi:integrase
VRDLYEREKRADTDLLFPRDDGLAPMEIRKHWNRALREAGIEDFRFHDLRHTAASYLAMNGATLAEIADVLGHKTLQMVKRYAHLSDQHTASVVERMNQNIFDATRS